MLKSDRATRGGQRRPDTDGVIEIPDGAHEATSLAKQFPESLFDSSQYVIGTDDQIAKQRLLA